MRKKKINIDFGKEKIYIYESPDGGKTIYRKEFCKPDRPRELMATQDNKVRSKYYYEGERSRPVKDDQACQLQTGDERDLEFKTIADVLKRSGIYGLNVEVIWSTLKAMKESRGKLSLFSALQNGADEWDI